MTFETFVADTVLRERPCRPRHARGARCESCLTMAELLQIKRNGGVGPHLIHHHIHGFALCGGPGQCAACDQPAPAALPVSGFECPEQCGEECDYDPQLDS